jgi:hypothetical protein
MASCLPGVPSGPVVPSANRPVECTRSNHATESETGASIFSVAATASAAGAPHKRVGSHGWVTLRVSLTVPNPCRSAGQRIGGQAQSPFFRQEQYSHMHAQQVPVYALIGLLCEPGVSMVAMFIQVLPCQVDVLSCICLLIILLPAGLST